MSIEQVADRVADTILVGGTAVTTGFLPLDLETWAVVFSMVMAGVYYGIRAWYYLKEYRRKMK